MVRHYIKTAWRTLTRHRAYSLTNLVGLTLGLTVVMLILTSVLDALSFDQHWSKKDEIYRIRTTHFDAEDNIRWQLDRAPDGLAAAWTADFPEIVDYSTIEMGHTRLMLDSLTKHHAELSVVETDTGFFNLFDIQVITGQTKHILPDAKNLVITKRAHSRYFGGQDVVGTIFYDIPDQGQPQPYIIQAIISDLPQNTHLQAEALVVTRQAAAFEPNGRNRGQYVQLKAGSDTATIHRKLNAWHQQRFPAEDGQSVIFSLQSVKDVHLRSTTGWDSPMRNIYLFSGIAVLILLLVSINFINLTFAHGMKRTAETGVRKVLGADRRHFIYQLGTESLMLFGISSLLAFIFYLAAFSPLEQYLGHPLTLGFHRSAGLSALLLSSWFALGLFCSIFPATMLSNVNVAQGLKKQIFFFRMPMNIGFTRVLVAIQFGIAMVVIICMVSIRAQLLYMDTKDLGYEPDNLIAVYPYVWEGKADAFKQQLLQHSSIQSVSLTYWTPFAGSAEFSHVDDPNKPGNLKTFVRIYADFDFVNTLGLRLRDGRVLQAGYGLDAITYTPETAKTGPYGNALVSESAAHALGLVVGQPSTLIERTPVGIIQDFHAASLRFPISEVIVEAQTNLDLGVVMLIRTTGGNRTDALSAIRDTWASLFPNKILDDMHWLSDKVDAQYAEERRQYQQLAFFGAVSLVIALLGVLGLVVYTIERRLKEIGIRKVMGASVYSVVALLSRSFAKPVFIAALPAFALAWWAMHRWLENFAYRIDMPLFLFFLSGVFTLCCMLLVVGFRTWGAARANPVESLRDE